MSLSVVINAKFATFSKITRHIGKRWSSKCHVEHLTRPVTQEELPMDPELSANIEDGKIKIRHNPGIMRLKTVNTPTRLENAVNVLFDKYGNKKMIEDAKKFSFSLMTRQLPLEKQDVILRRDKIRNKIIQTDGVDLTNLSEEVKRSYIKVLDAKCDEELKKHIHWKPRHYDASQGMMYLVARLAQNYAVLLQILGEIWKRDPDYVPKNLYNFGSGVGSVLWAVQNNSSWKRTISEYYCVDPSVDINTIARLLLQDGQEEQEMHIKGVFFRKFQLSPITNSYSTVISAYTLIENSSQSERLKLVKSLWDMTDDYLILVEMGSYAGHRLIQEAKDYILLISKEEDSDKKAFVFAPCPHQLSCPKLTLPNKVPCAFVVDYKPLEIISKTGNKMGEKYTYVIMKKMKLEEKGSSVKPWPRLVNQSTLASKHVHCRMCCPNGKLDHVVITKKKHSKELYAVSKSLQLGDYLPVIYTEKSEKSVEKTTMGYADDGIDFKSTIHNSGDNDLQNTQSDLLNSDRITQSTTNLDIESTENYTCK